MVLEQQYRQQADELRHVLPAQVGIEQLVTGSPFHELTVFESIKRQVRRVCLRIAEIAIGAPLYVENEYRELAVLEPRARALLTHLIRKGVITSWRLGVAAPDQPYVTTCRLSLKTIELPSGTHVTMGGNTGGGSGPTPQDALIPALAELLERYSTAMWREESIVRGSYENLRAEGAISPETFSFFSPAQLKQELFAESRVSADRKLDWVHARLLADARSVLIPAQLVYMFYGVDHPEQPVFWDTNSNGVAAGQTYEDAAYRAICEAIERDAFFMFWLNRLSPPRVRLESIPDPEVQRLLKECARYRLTVHILDCTTDVGVPTFVGVAIDPYGEVPVAVSAVTDLDVDQALRKLVHELTKFSHAILYTTADTLPKVPEEIVSMGQRQLYWCKSDWRAAIGFFIAGPEKTYADLVAGGTHEPTALSPLERVAEILRKKKLPGYLIDVTNTDAREAGLRVVRAVMPDLIPIYFREARKYLGITRLYTAPHTMGYESGARTAQDLNSTPHPFL